MYSVVHDLSAFLRSTNKVSALTSAFNVNGLMKIVEIIVMI